MSEALVNGARIAYQQLGDGPDLVLVHGLAASRAFWFGAYALALQGRYRVTLFDLRGHGYSERTPTGHSAAAMAGDLRDLLDHLNIECCRLAGHSYGGSVALEFACAQPQRVKALCLMDTKVNALQPFQRLSDMPELTPFEQDVQRRTTIDWNREEQVGLRFLDIVARIRLSEEGLPSRDIVTPFGEGRGATRAARAWLDLIEQPGVREEVLSAGASAELLQERLRDTPLLLMYGGLSRCLPSCERLALLLPQAQVEMLADGGHFFPLSHAAFVRSKLEPFLASVI